MSKQTKLILSVLGAAAIAVPVILLLTLSSKTPSVAEIPTGTRNIDAQNVSDAAKRTTASSTPSPSVVPTPSPATNSAIPNLITSPVPSAKP